MFMRGGMTAIYSSSNYLYQNAQVGPSSSYWWLGSPLIYAVPNLSFQSIALGKLDESEYSDELLVAIMPHGFRPVISLKADTIVTSGSSATAYNVD